MPPAEALMKGNFAHLPLAMLAANAGSRVAAEQAAARAARLGAADVAAEAERQYLAALRACEEQASAGNPIAAERAGQMLVFGPMLFGGLAADGSRARRWLAQAAAAGRASAAFLLERLDRPEPPVASAVADGGRSLCRELPRCDPAEA